MSCFSVIEKLLMKNIHENGEKPFFRNGLESKPFFRNGIKSKPLCSNHLDYATESNGKG